MTRKNKRPRPVRQTPRRVSILVLLLLLAVFAGMVFWGNRQLANLAAPDYTSFSNGERGASLLFDTLRQLQFPVRVLYRPVNAELDTRYAVLIIEPNNPRLTAETAAAMLDWVRRGGRLIFLENRLPTALDRLLTGEPFDTYGLLRHYRPGRGEILTGPADSITNLSLMHNPRYGAAIAYVLYHWEAGRVYFAEYYHGFHAPQNAFNQMPLLLRLVVFQAGLTAVLLAWHWGKRFGRPVPFYEETERGENEDVYVLARLYYKIDKRRNHGN